MAVAGSLEGIPQAKGNPIPGQFAYSGNPVTIPLNGWKTGDKLVIAAHAKVIKLLGDGSSWQWATQVIGYDQGTLIGGGPITDPNRTDPAKALGAPDASMSPPATGFYSLGFASNGDGWIKLGYGYPIYTGANPDVNVIEVTWGRSGYQTESADVYAVTGTTETLIGSITNHDPGMDGTSYLDLSSVSGYIEAIKLVDTTPRTVSPAWPANADGFDLDAVGVRYLVEAQETAWAGKEGFTGKNWATYFYYTVQGWWEEVETLTVPGTGATVSSVSTLESGKKYKFEASGTYRFANWGEAGIADAQYSLRVPGQPYSYHSNPVNTWVSGDDIPAPYTNYLEVQSGTGPLDWDTDGTVNPDHVYTIEVTGGGSPAQFRILDTYYGDNSGGITVTIYEWVGP